MKPVRRLAAPILVLVGLSFAVLAYAGWVEPQWLEVSRHEVRAPVDLVKIAHLTDLHVDEPGALEERVIGLLERELPGAIMVTGDLAFSLTSDRYREVLSRLHAPLGVWFVAGNWDSWEVVEQVKKLGIRALKNEAAAIQPRIWIAGFDDLVAGYPDIEKTLAHIPTDAFVIALFHSPAYFDQVAGRIALALSGHTHGGQIRVPLLRPLWLPPGSGKYVSGWYSRDGSRMYVSRGIGTSIIRARFFARPEVAIITLRRTP